MKIVATRGKNRVALFSPATCSTRPNSASTAASIKFWSPVGTSPILRVAK